MSKILLSCGRALLYDFRCRWDGHVKAITATCPDNGRVSSRRTQAPLITRRPLQRKPCLGCTVLTSPVTTTAVSDVSEFFVAKTNIAEGHENHHLSAFQSIWKATEIRQGHRQHLLGVFWNP